MRCPIRPALLLVIFALSACVGTDVGNPQEEPEEDAEVELNFSGYEQTNSSALVLEERTRIDSAWVVLDEFQFQQSSSCGEEGEADVLEPLVIDLLASEPTYEPPFFIKEVGDYCRLDIGFADVGVDQLPQDAPQRLADHAIVVEGERADGVSFSIQGDFDDKLHLTGAMQSFQLEEGRQSLIVGFALNAWIDEGALEDVEGEDPIVIDGTNHPELLDEFYKKVKRSAGLFRDQNDNAELDPDEQRDSMAEGRDETPDNNGRDEANRDAGADGDRAPDGGL
ncbi:MAG: hypothetical protein ACLFVJ_14850 [Persicimonas sp.]